jgi:hypothetical protein
MSRSYTSSPSSVFVACSGTASAFLVGLLTLIRVSGFADTKRGCQPLNVDDPSEALFSKASPVRNAIRIRSRYAKPRAPQEVYSIIELPVDKAVYFGSKNPLLTGGNFVSVIDPVFGQWHGRKNHTARCLCPKFLPRHYIWALRAPFPPTAAQGGRSHFFLLSEECS